MTKRYSKKQVSKNHSVKNLWVTVSRKVYDITQFLDSHPGGEEIILQFGGRDVTSVLMDEKEHLHSDVAYEMLQEYFIGDLTDTEDDTDYIKDGKKGGFDGAIEGDAADAAMDNTSGSNAVNNGQDKGGTDTLSAANNDASSDSYIRSRKSPSVLKSNGLYSGIEKKTFIDPAKPMLAQVWNGEFEKDFYLKQVHLPRHTKGSAPLFASPYLEVFSKTPWWVIPIFWTPIITYCMLQCLAVHTIPTLALLFILGAFSWTLIEYTLHRFLFHLDDLIPPHRFFYTLHFLLHGVHHFLPMDRLRLVMPPALGFALAWPFWTAYVRVFPEAVGQGLISGAMAGFVSYDLMHYYVHHGRPLSQHMREMKSYHLDHHYKNAHLGFGITSKVWDRVFGTVLQ